MSNFTEVSLNTDGEAAEAIAEVLQPFAYQNSVVLEQLGDPDSPDPFALQDLVNVKIYLPEDRDTPDLRREIEEILYHLNRMYPIPSPTFKVIPETDWANAWKENYHPFHVGGRLWIIPSWYDSKALEAYRSGSDGSEVLDIILDPGMAFGTGTHPTTQMCLLFLEKYIKGGEQVLDVGTGSGILAIAAAKLGALKIVGIDNDPIATKAAETNCHQNNVQDRTFFMTGELQQVSERQWDIVLVNILAPVIVNLLTSDNLMDYLGERGILILSGIIDAQVPELESAIVSSGGVIDSRMIVRDWVTLLVRAQ